MGENRSREVRSVAGECETGAAAAAAAATRSIAAARSSAMDEGPKRASGHKSQANAAPRFRPIEAKPAAAADEASRREQAEALKRALPKGSRRGGRPRKRTTNVDSSSSKGGRARRLASINVRDGPAIIEADAATLVVSVGAELDRGSPAPSVGALLEGEADKPIPNGHTSAEEMRTRNDERGEPGIISLRAPTAPEALAGRNECPGIRGSSAAAGGGHGVVRPRQPGGGVQMTLKGLVERAAGAWGGRRRGRPTSRMRFQLEDASQHSPRPIRPREAGNAARHVRPSDEDGSGVGVVEDVQRVTSGRRSRGARTGPKGSEGHPSRSGGQDRPASTVGNSPRVVRERLVRPIQPQEMDDSAGDTQSCGRWPPWPLRQKGQGRPATSVGSTVVRERLIRPIQPKAIEEDRAGDIQSSGYQAGQDWPATAVTASPGLVREPLVQPIQPRETQGRAGDTQLSGWLPPRPPRPSRQPAAGEQDRPWRDEAAARSSQAVEQRKRKRNRQRDRDQTPTKRTRGSHPRQRRSELQAEDLASVLRYLEGEFAVKERLSKEQTWCIPIPHERKVSTVRKFYRAFHDVSTLPIMTCRLCYRKRTRKELREIPWDQWVSSPVPRGERSPFACGSCFPGGEPVSVCVECARCLGCGSLSSAVHLHSRLGCEHMFPDELKGLTPVEEKLISLNSCYGFVTRYSIPGGQTQAVRYPRHVKGHITVFPNNVKELARKVLPHPLWQTMDEIHVSWQGAEKPAPCDLSGLLSVRRQVVERALIWLKKNNPHYADIEIDRAEMDSWGTPSHGVPRVVYDRMERNEPSAWEKTRTAQVVPPAERAMDDDSPAEIEEVLAQLLQGQDVSDRGSRESEGNGADGTDDAEPDDGAKTINEITSSGMFALDGPPEVSDAEKLRFACNAAIAVGLRHNHDISFIATQRKTMALVFYVTNYATKVEDPVWKRVAAAAELLPPGAGSGMGDGAEVRGDSGAGDDGRQNKTRQFLMKVANRVFTERPLSQVEVVANLLGYATELTNSSAWAFLNVSLLYWQVFRQWPHLRREGGAAVVDGSVDESILVEEAGQRICRVEAYRHRGDVLQGLCLYDYVSLVRLKRSDRDEGPTGWGEVPFESGWAPGSRWVQALRRPGKQATVCLDGYLSKDFDEDDEGSCYRRKGRH
ncbi:hypothetical protein HIM_12443 [Hirsutella minnesotensis 3608]|uniref:DUF6570 domain-containing protein n=1 Tax=Hirsutella minnesotensis 3608 TaxID=1043627 RepID=A0A0F7ZEX8_9HYPO|nr:hypothetical protein HIM_12443 [Hirsutella minnesotensis 3608]